MNRDDATDGRCVTRVGGVVVLHGPALRAALDCVLITARCRRLSGLPLSGIHRELAAALHQALTATDGQKDIEAAPELETLAKQPTVGVGEAAERLGLSRRQTRRLAPRLNGRKTGGHWAIDEVALAEHAAGQKWTS